MLQVTCKPAARLVMYAVVKLNRLNSVEQKCGKITFMNVRSGKNGGNASIKLIANDGNAKKLLVTKRHIMPAY